MPLVWAHAEYLKLLRSVTDGRVFDRIAAVRSAMRRPGALQAGSLQAAPAGEDGFEAGYTLRFIAEQHFRAAVDAGRLEDCDNVESTKVGFAGSFADMPTRPEQTGKAFIYSFLAEGKPLGGPQFRCGDRGGRVNTGEVLNRESLCVSTLETVYGWPARFSF